MEREKAGRSRGQMGMPSPDLAQRLGQVLNEAMMRRQFGDLHVAKSAWKDAQA